MSADDVDLIITYNGGFKGPAVALVTVATARMAKPTDYVNVIPEPSAMFLLATGLLGLLSHLMVPKLSFGGKTESPQAWFAVSRRYFIPDYAPPGLFSAVRNTSPKGKRG